MSRRGERIDRAIIELLHDIDGDHRPVWANDIAQSRGKDPIGCAWCFPADGSWPCAHRMALGAFKAEVGR